MSALVERGARAVRGGARRGARYVRKRLLYRRGNFNGTFDDLICQRADRGARGRHRTVAGLPLGRCRCPPAPIRSRAKIVYNATCDDLSERPIEPTMTGETTSHHSRGCRRQLVQPRPVLSTGRRHGSIGRRRLSASTSMQADRRADKRFDAHARAATPLDPSWPRVCRRRLGIGQRERSKGRRFGMWSRHILDASRP